MRRLLGALAFGLALMAQSATHAQQPDTSIAAQQLIAQSQAAGVFEALPSEDRIVVRHGRSGLVCRFEPDNRNRLLIFPQAARGEDVACDSTDGAETVTLYATRFSFEVTPQELIDGAVNAIHERFPDARALPVSQEAPGVPPSHSAQFMVTRDGAPMFTRVTIALVGQWAIKLRYTAPAGDGAAAQRGEATAIAIWNAALSELTSTRL
jgi:hypothetical protein